MNRRPKAWLRVPDVQVLIHEGGEQDSARRSIIRLIARSQALGFLRALGLSRHPRPVCYHCRSRVFFAPMRAMEIRMSLLTPIGRPVDYQINPSTCQFHPTPLAFCPVSPPAPKPPTPKGIARAEALLQAGHTPQAVAEQTGYTEYVCKILQNNLSGCTVPDGHHTVADYVEAMASRKGVAA